MLASFFARQRAHEHEHMLANMLAGMLPSMPASTRKQEWSHVF